MTGIWVTVALGEMAGLFGFIAWRLAFPPPPPLATALARLERRPEIVDDDTGPAWRRQLGQRTATALNGFDLGLDDLRANARMAGTSLDAHLGSKVTCALMPLGFVTAIALLFLLAGVTVPIGLLAVAGMVAVVIGFIAPDIALRKAADERRREFALAFGSYLDLVSISLAGGMGTEAALVEAARVGDSWSFHLLRRAVDVAQIDGATVWSTFARLGEELRVPALVELAASVALAGNEGAKVRSSIAVKADTLRAVELAEAESEAQAATERMAIPTAMLLFGFVLLIGFPAVITVVGGF
jgi:Flp pilus assembly protein TadB